MNLYERRELPHLIDFASGIVAATIADAPR